MTNPKITETKEKRNADYYKKIYNKRTEIENKIESLKKERKDINLQRNNEFNEIYFSYTPEERTDIKKTEVNEKIKKVHKKYDDLTNPINEKIYKLNNEYREIF